MPFRVISESLPAVLMSIWAATLLVLVAALVLEAGATAWVGAAAFAGVLRVRRSRRDGEGGDGRSGEKAAIGRAE
jgi:hypothetical protein